MGSWFESEELWQLLEPQLTGVERKKAGVEEAGHVAKLLALKAGSNLLDLCCGPGRHSVPLARLGFEVTGIDRNERYLDLARTYASEQGVKVELVKDDMRSFCRPGAFDGAINLFTSFGYFDTEDEERQVLRNVRQSLRPGARFVMDLAGKEVLARIYTPRDWMENPDGTLLLFDREVTPGWTQIRNRWIAVRDGKKTEFNFTHRIYSAAELSKLMQEEGFEICGTYGGLDGRPYDREAQRLVIVAQVPSSGA